MTSRIASLLTTTIAANLLAVLPASAGYDSPLYTAACEYREAVREFERTVIRSRFLSSVHRRVADDLEDATARLRSAARHPDRVGRLLDAWHQVQHLHDRAAAIIFGDPVCAGDWELTHRWNIVQRAYRLVAVEIAGCHLTPVFPGHGHGYAPPVVHPPRRPIPGAVPVPRQHALPPANHPSQWNPNRGQHVEPFWIQQRPMSFPRSRGSVSTRTSKWSLPPGRVTANLNWIMR